MCVSCISVLISDDTDLVPIVLINDMICLKGYQVQTSISSTYFNIGDFIELNVKARSMVTNANAYKPLCMHLNVKHMYSTIIYINILWMYSLVISICWITDILLFLLRIKQS